MSMLSAIQASSAGGTPGYTSTDAKTILYINGAINSRGWVKSNSITNTTAQLGKINSQAGTYFKGKITNIRI